MNRLALVIFLCCMITGIAVASGPTVPSGIQYYIPVNVLNSQASAMAANTQVSIAFNALAYQSYEANTLNNTEFFYSNGIVIPSWLEGNTLAENSLANTLYQSANVLFWILPNNSRYCALYHLLIPFFPPSLLSCRP